MKKLFLGAAAALAIAASAAVGQDSNTSASGPDCELAPGSAAAQRATLRPYLAYQQIRLRIESNPDRFASARQVALNCHWSVADLELAFRLYGHEDLSQFLARLRKNPAAKSLPGKHDTFAGGPYALWGYAALASR